MTLILCSEAGSGLPRGSTQPYTWSHQWKDSENFSIWEQARRDLREMGREHEEWGKLEKEILEEMHEPAPLSREEEISALSTGWKKSIGFMPKQPLTSRTSQDLWHLHSRTFKFSVQKTNFITKRGSFVPSSLPKPASGFLYNYCHLIVTMVPDSLIFIFSVLNHLDEFT